MKPLFILALLLFMQGHFAFAQRVVHVDSVTSYTFHHPHKHYWSTRVGEGLLIGGGSVMALGGLIALAQVNSYNRQGEAGSGIAGEVIGGLGLYVAGYGAVFFVIGKIYEKRHKERFSLVGSANQVGLAYNFR